MKKTLLTVLAMAGSLLSSTAADIAGTYNLNGVVSLYFEDGGSVSSESEDATSEDWIPCTIIKDEDGNYKFNDPNLFGDNKYVDIIYSESANTLTILSGTDYTKGFHITSLEAPVQTCVSLLNIGVMMMVEPAFHDVVFTIKGDQLISDWPILLYNDDAQGSPSTSGCMLVAGYSLIKEGADEPEDPNKPVVVSTLAQMIALGSDYMEEPVYVTITSDNLHVTYVQEGDGLAILDDGTGAVQAGSEEEDSPAMGESLNQKIQGSLTGWYWGMNMFEVNFNESDFIFVEDVYDGISLTADQVDAEAYAWRLINIEATKEYPIVRDQESEQGMLIGNTIAVVDMFGTLPDDYVWPKTAIKVTGIVLPDYTYGLNNRTLITVRNADDIQTQTSTICNVEAAQDTTVVYNLLGHFINSLEAAPAGFYIVNGMKVFKQNR